MASLKNIVNSTVLLGMSALLINCSSKSEISRNLESRLNEYYGTKNASKVREYNPLVKESINTSRQEPVIIVDKSDYSLKLFNLGILIKEYPVELGNPIGDKEFQGDRKTPEGIYKVTWKRYENPDKTKYYKALLLNYPNRLDSIEFKRRKMWGEIPQNVDIGNCIEIHGHGSGRKGNDGGRNWTDGCVALSNENMDDLFRYVGKGTLVTIVDSMY